MKRVLGFQKCNVKVLLKGWLSKKSFAKVHLIQIDDYYFYKAKEIERDSNNKGMALFNSIPDGCYLAKISLNKSIFETIIVTNNSDLIMIKLPFLFGWSRKIKLLDKKIIGDYYEQFRTDKEICFKCKKTYDNLIDKFECKYCEKYFCTKHRLPENHNCWGEPKSPPGSFREVSTPGGRIVTGT